ncbi:hypothetical protein EPI10_006420 [Gossypium australe]|uniref:Uncharacterized protein n=1 Tax=Gossypium australe TaxID=47621 RepID=A0A5B6WR14_9ROSI|nr:hypothetical protein EPI10_006420 [Gossypium australe]
MGVSYGDFAIGSNPTQSNDNLGHLTKKVRQRPTDLPSLEDPIVDENRGLVLGDRSTQQEEFKLINGDVTVETMDGIPSINLSERVHKHMARTMIIKLMGRRIAFSTLLGKFQNLW